MTAPYIAATIERTPAASIEVRFYGKAEIGPGVIGDGFDPITVTVRRIDGCGYRHRRSTPEEVRAAEAIILDGQRRRAV